MLCSYQLTSGYKPAPMDLSFIKLTPSQEAMVDKLAENAHNVWARDRIRQGWTYGIQQVHGHLGMSSEIPFSGNQLTLQGEGLKYDHFT